MKKELSPIETAVLELIPRGYENRQSLKNLYTLLDMKEREIQAVISRLTAKSIPVCSCRGTEPGVYIPLTEEERTRGLESIKSQAREMNKRIRAVSQADLEHWHEGIYYTYQTSLLDGVKEYG